MKPDYVSKLEAIYGPPSQEAFGSAVFHLAATWPVDLEQVAQLVYRHYVSKVWERLGGDAAWMRTWREVYVRADGTTKDIVAEMRTLDPDETAYTAESLFDNIDEAAAGQQAFAAAFNDPLVEEVRAYRIGDSEAMSGLIIAGRRQNGEVTTIIYLMD